MLFAPSNFLALIPLSGSERGFCQRLVWGVTLATARGTDSAQVNFFLHPQIIHYPSGGSFLLNIFTHLIRKK